MEKIIFGFDQVDEIVKRYLLPKLETHKIFTFKGPLGAGKTTLIKSFLAQLGVDQIVTSPTFTYVKYYKIEGGRNCYHFDLYRLNSLNSFLEMGFDECLNSDGLSVIEWPGIIEDLLQRVPLKSKTFSVVLDYVEGDLEKRCMTLER